MSQLKATLDKAFKEFNILANQAAVTRDVNVEVKKRLGTTKTVVVTLSNATEDFDLKEDMCGSPRFEAKKKARGDQQSMAEVERVPEVEHRALRSDGPKRGQPRV
jgi:plasmid maintenance system antidote protein VapI